MALSENPKNIRDCIDLIDERLLWLDGVTFLLITQGETKFNMLEGEDIGNIASLIRYLHDQIREASDALSGFYFAESATKEEIS